MITDKVKKKIAKVKLLAMDVDGTLTDAMVFYSKDGEAMKKFYLRDGMGIELMHKADLLPAIITTEQSEIIVKRAQKLRIKHLIQGCRNKKQALQDLAQKLNIKLEEIAFIGDDVNDYQAMMTAGVTACPADAVDAIREVADYTCSNKGGHGAVREFIELILVSQNKPIVLPEKW